MQWPGSASMEMTVSSFPMASAAARSASSCARSTVRGQFLWWCVTLLRDLKRAYASLEHAAARGFATPSE
eukprot:11227840-Lingulodinium_polyedra.AAC.1